MDKNTPPPLRTNRKDKNTLPSMFSSFGKKRNSAKLRRENLGLGF